MCIFLSFPSSCYSFSFSFFRVYQYIPWCSWYNLVASDTGRYHSSLAPFLLRTTGTTSVHLLRTGLSFSHQKCFSLFLWPRARFQGNWANVRTSSYCCCIRRYVLPGSSTAGYDDATYPGLNMTWHWLPVPVTPRCKNTSRPTAWYCIQSTRFTARTAPSWTGCVINGQND